MVNPLYNEYDYKIPPKRLEQFQKYNEIIQWGRQNPTRFAELVFGIQFTDHQKWMILSSWVPSTVVWLCSRATGKAKPLYTPLKYKKKRGLKIKKGVLGELEVGDEVYNENGKLVKVTQIKPVIFEELYEISLEDGSIEECGPYHEWCVKEDGVECVREKQYIYNNFKQILF